MKVLRIHYKFDEDPPLDVPFEKVKQIRDSAGSIKVDVEPDYTYIATRIEAVERDPDSDVPLQ